MTATALKLERFDPAPHAGERNDNNESVLMQRARAEAYAEGYAAGQAAASGRAEEHNHLAAALARAIEREVVMAPARAMEEAGGAVKMLLQTIFPTLSEKGFAAEAASAFARAARGSGRGVIEIAVSKQHAAAVEKLFAALAPGEAFEIRVDPALAGSSARATWSGGGVEFDMDAAVAACLDAFEKAIHSLASEKSI